MKPKYILLFLSACMIYTSCRKTEPKVLPPGDTTNTDTVGTDTLIAVCNGHAQLQWHAFFDKLGADVNYSMIGADTAGNVYLSTYIKTGEDIDADPGSGVLPVTGSDGILVIKLDTAKHLVWAKKIEQALHGGNPLDDYGYSAGQLQTDYNQNVSVVYYRSHRLNGPTTYHFILNATGELIHQSSITGGNGGAGRGISYGPQGGILVSAEGSVSVTNINGNSVFNIATNGPVGGTFSPTGNVFITGKSYKADDFDTAAPGIQTVTVPDSAGLEFLYLAKYDATGLFQWVKYIAPGQGKFSGGEVSIDNAGNAYLITLETGPAGRLIKKYSPDGNLIWQRYFNNIASITGFDDANNFFAGLTKFDPSGNVVWTINGNNGKSVLKDNKHIYISNGPNIWQYSLCN